MKASINTTQSHRKQWKRWILAKLECFNSQTSLMPRLFFSLRAKNSLGTRLLSNGATSMAMKSSGDIHGLPPTALDNTPRPRWIPRITTPTNEFRFPPPVLALQRRHNWRAAKCLQYPKKQLHTTTLGCGANTEEYCRGCIGQLTDLQPKKFLHWLANLLNSGTQIEEERLFKVQWPSCSCAVLPCIYCFFAMTMYSFVKTNYCC